MKNNHADDALQKAIFDIFRLDTSVVLQVRGDQEKRLEEMRKEREKEEEKTLERTRNILEKGEPIVLSAAKHESNQISGTAYCRPFRVDQ